MYLDLMERALRHPDTRSVALTGSYGSGKSSVLHALGRSYWDRWFPWWHRRRTIELSLSTLDPRTAPKVPVDNPAEREMSNRIQKELVKQLLYRLPPRRTPHSRFPRATAPRLSLAGTLTVLALLGLGWAATELSGWHTTLGERLDGLGWSSAWFWGGVAVGLLALTLAVWRALAGRYAFQAGLKAGALTVSLEPNSSSYFDQYLDEIIYFFEVSRTSVVLIEDVDRFDDAVVFDTLRALNTLVNGSGQVGRRVVFVYAIRDSVLGRIGATADDAPKVEGQVGSGDLPLAASKILDPALELHWANRAKYFDVIIPIVPFATTDNARDLMLGVMAPHVSDAEHKPGISPALVRLAARHVADMRTIWSIRNEFEVHYDRLVTSAKHPMPEITHDIVFSLVLLRATSPEAYESIRLATSPLDALTGRWLKLVEENLAAQTQRLTDLSTQLENGKSLQTRAARAGKKLNALRPELLELAYGFVADKVEFAGPLTDADLADLSGWQQIASGTRQTVSLSLRANVHRSRTQAQLGPKMLARMIGMPIDPQAWEEADLDDLKDKIDNTREEIAFLRHHTWKQLYARDDLTIAPQGSEPPGTQGRVSFDVLVGAYAPTPMVAEVIAQGYLPRHFARYASMFYGEDVGLNAAEYIARAIEPGTPIMEYALGDPDVRQILREQKADDDDNHLFDEPAIYNLDVVRHLLEHRPGAAERVAKHLADRWGTQEETFVGRFFEREAPEVADQLTRLMAPAWKQALHYISVDAPVTPHTRLHLVDAVLGAISADARDDLDTDVARYLSEHYADLQAVTRPADKDRAAVVMATFAAAGAAIDDLSKLNETAREAATQTTLYPISATNLRALGGADHVALDFLHSEPSTRPIYEHAVNQLGVYLQALVHLNPAGTPVADPGLFADVLNDIAARPQSALLDELVGATSISCRVPDLQQTEPETWPAVVKHGRTDPNFSNVQRYIAEYDLDDHLGAFLAERQTITTADTIPQPDRLTLATAILAARDTISDPTVRIALTASITPGQIPISQVAPADANLVGPLLDASLLADEPATFDPALLDRWEHFEAAVAASDKFGEFADTTTMPTQYLAPALASGTILESTKATLVTNLASLVPPATTDEATAIADALANRLDRLDLVRLQALHEAGASNKSLVRAIVAQGEGLSIEDLRAILLPMGGHYTRVSTGHRGGTVRFTPDQYHRALLARLEGVTHGGADEVHTKSHGTNLEATLRQPRV
ncbi:YobI family P-loop NTPase [Cellulomonas xiejunii]|uniref:YobI family P-loop NTPase n=1 Tax=Cellulomonas xiejunii TaxID=2968083 RepID=UPI001D0E515B|nr:hypothetical protein [Cellulomonas xiejunii]MCC2313478.1 hypothetical protein [Cellulomonas xiejunii]